MDKENFKKNMKEIFLNPIMSGTKICNLKQA